MVILTLRLYCCNWIVSLKIPFFQVCAAFSCSIFPFWWYSCPYLLQSRIFCIGISSIDIPVAAVVYYEHWLVSVTLMQPPNHSQSMNFMIFSVSCIIQSIPHLPENRLTAIMPKWQLQKSHNPPEATWQSRYLKNDETNHIKRLFNWLTDYVYDSAWNL